MVDRFLGLRHHAIVGGHHQDDDVGGLGTAGAHRRERGVAGGVEEGDHAARRLHVVRADVLRDAAGFASSHTRGADVVEQRSLAVIDVAHHGDHRRAGEQLAGLRGFFFLGERVRVVELGREGLVAHLFDQDHRRLLIERLIDRHHLAELHQLLDDLGRLDAHLVREVGNGDRLRHVHFLDHGLCRRDGVIAAVAVAVATTAAAARCAPAGTAAAAVATGLQRALLGRVVSPARRQLLALDRLLFAGLRSTGRCRRTGARRCLVDRALDVGLDFGLGLFFLRDEHLLRRTHHRADRRGFVLCGRTALAQVGQTRLLIGRIVGGLDHTHRRGLGRFGRRCGRRHCSHGLRTGGDLFGGLVGRSLRTRLGGLALALLLLFAHAALLGDLFFLAAQQLGLAARFIGAALELVVVDHRRRRRRRFAAARGWVIALDEGALLDRLHVDRARLAGGVGLLDFGRALARDADLLALGRHGAAMRGAQVVEQLVLVRFDHAVVRRALGHAGSSKLFEQRGHRAVQLGGKLGDGGHCHRDRSWIFRCSVQRLVKW